MSQDFISLSLTDEPLTGAVTGLDQMELALSGLQATPAAERDNLLYMGAKSEVFCRRALRVMQANPHIVPPSLAEDLAAAADLTAPDQLRPLLDRLQKLTSRISDSIGLLGSDAMHVALDGYAQIKLPGGDAGLDELRKELGARWSQCGRAGGGAGVDAGAEAGAGRRSKTDVRAGLLAPATAVPQKPPPGGFCMSGGYPTTAREPIATPNDSHELPHLHSPFTYFNVC